VDEFSTDYNVLEQNHSQQSCLSVSKRTEPSILIDNDASTVLHINVP